MRQGEHTVRMGEYAACRQADGVLVALGLGSCIGLALIDRRAGVAGLAHIVLPAGTPAPGDPPVKYAPSGVPFLVERVIALGGRRSSLQAVIVGGASMFATSSALEVGQRNSRAVIEELNRARIGVAANDTGGKKGRTIRVYVGDGRVTVRLAGDVDRDILGAPMPELAAS